ncbi:hypothetical protein [Streptomyces sp. NPDC059649]
MSDSNQYQAQVCTTCGGKKGFVETSWSADGVRHDVWRPCPPCSGTGVR